jgi:hypothetical protein
MWATFIVVLHAADAFDELYKVIAPLHPTQYKVTTPWQFRQALSRIIAGMTAETK